MFAASLTPFCITANCISLELDSQDPENSSYIAKVKFLVSEEEHKQIRNLFSGRTPPQSLVVYICYYFFSSVNEVLSGALALSPPPLLVVRPQKNKHLVFPYKRMFCLFIEEIVYLFYLGLYKWNLVQSRSTSRQSKLHRAQK